jgi:hypothetical protein
MNISTDFQHLILVCIKHKSSTTENISCTGSYVNAYKNQRRRLEDEKVNRRSVLTNYKTFVQNGGFGPAFGNVDQHIYEQKVRN